MMITTSGIIIGSFFGIIGLTLTFYGIWVLLMANKSKNWPSTKGRVTESSIERALPLPLKEGFSLQISSGNSSLANPQKHLIITYEYQVNGKNYSANRRYFGEQISDWTRDEKLLEEEMQSEYFIGKEVEVFYNPENPQTATLSPNKVGLKTYYLLFIGTIILLSGIATVLGKIRIES